MLLTLTTRSLHRLLKARGRNRLDVPDIPKYVIEHLKLRGLVLDTELLRGWSLDRLDDLRNTADQAGCPCLILRESTPISLIGASPAAMGQLHARLNLVGRAAHRLGCNAVALSLVGLETEEHLEPATEFLREVMDRVDRMEMNLLVEPGDQRLENPDGLIELIKKVGGFRIGTLPSFKNALAAGDCASVLRQTAPYASAVLATCPDVDAEGTMSSTAQEQLRECVLALSSVGYEQILAIDYQGEEAPEPAIDAAREQIIAALEEE